MKGNVQFKEKVVKTLEKKAFGLLLKIICVQLAIMHLNGIGVNIEREYDEEDGNNELDDQNQFPEVNQIASRLAWEVSANLDHGAFEETLCTGVITNIKPTRKDKKTFQHEEPREIEYDPPPYSNSDEKKYIVQYDTPWEGSVGVDPRLTSLRYEWFETNEMADTVKVLENSVDEKNVAIQNFHYHVHVKEFQNSAI